MLGFAKFGAKVRKKWKEKGSGDVFFRLSLKSRGVEVLRS
jgi:hypothetical protein